MAERNPYDDDADGASKPPSRRPEQAASDRIDEIRQYLSDLHARRNVIKRTVTKSGQELDWVPIESQTKNGKIAHPPTRLERRSLTTGIAQSDACRSNSTIQTQSSVHQAPCTDPFGLIHHTS